LIQGRVRRRKKDSRRRGPGFGNCASRAPSGLFQQPARGQLASRKFPNSIKARNGGEQAANDQASIKQILDWLGLCRKAVVRELLLMQAGPPSAGNTRQALTPSQWSRSLLRLPLRLPVPANHCQGTGRSHAVVDGKVALDAGPTQIPTPLASDKPASSRSRTLGLTSALIRLVFPLASWLDSTVATAT
jgi:hypothetical protein